MKRNPIILTLLPALLFLSGCFQGPKKERTDWSVSLQKESKAPYGTHIAWQSLPHYFPGARIEPISGRFRYTSVDNNMQYHGDSAALFVMVGLEYYISDEEWTRVQAFASSGNEVFILCNTLDSKVAAALDCRLRGANEEYPLSRYNDGRHNLQALSLLPDTTVHYGHTGRSLTGFFRMSADTANGGGPQSTVPADTTVTLALDTTETVAPADETEHQETAAGEKIYSGQPEILGYAYGRPDFIRYTIGSGHITLHAAPLVLSNYFLLQPHNRPYLDSIWHAFPANISSIYWNEYYKRSTEGSDLGVLWRYPATRWALIIAIGVLITYVVFGMKRRQRIIPVIKPVENASVSFVETIGRLYYNKGNHANLAEKMIQHFLEWVRTYYYIDTSALNEDFIGHLVSKSGQPEEKIRRLLQMIQDVRTNAIVIDQNQLYQLHHIIQSFYNNNRN